MSKALINLGLRTIALGSAVCGWRLLEYSAEANPAGGAVAQGGASFHTSGSVETITTSGNTAINWQSFSSIGAGETTTFVEPSSASVVWNTINGTSPSQILGNLNANGYVILQNQAGFFVGGQAAITARGFDHDHGWWSGSELVERRGVGNLTRNPRPPKSSIMARSISPEGGVKRFCWRMTSKMTGRFRLPGET